MDPAMESYSNRQERNGVQWVCRMHLQVDPGCADDDLGKLNHYSRGQAVLRDSRLHADHPHGVMGDEDHWSHCINFPFSTTCDFFCYYC